MKAARVEQEGVLRNKTLFRYEFEKESFLVTITIWCAGTGACKRGTRAVLVRILPFFLFPFSLYIVSIV